MTLRNDDVIQVATHGIIVGRAIVVGHEFVVGNAPFAGVRQQLNMAECPDNLGIQADVVCSCLQVRNGSTPPAAAILGTYAS